MSVHSQLNLPRSIWLGEKNPANQQAKHCTPQRCSLADLDAVSLLSSLVTTQQKKLPDKGNSLSVHGTASHLASKGPIHILFPTAYRFVIHAAETGSQCSQVASSALTKQTKTESVTEASQAVNLKL